MLEIGKTFVKNNNTFCLLHFLNYNNENYGIFSVEDFEKKISFIIYKIELVADNYNFYKIDDDYLKFTLFEMVGMEGL